MAGLPWSLSVEFASRSVTTLLVGVRTWQREFFEVSPDRKWVLTYRNDELESDLMLVENFR